jgi:hypothetical protein
MDAQSLKLVVHPTVAWQAIDEALRDSGFERGEDTAATPPTLPGEPEAAHWFRSSSDTLVSYSFNPVVFLRLLDVEGTDAASVAGTLRERLRCISHRDLDGFLASSEPRELLLGLYTAAELKAIGLLSAVEALRTHTHQRVSQAAARTAEVLSLALVAVGAERLASEQRRHPDRSVVFPRLGDAGERREILLWLLHDSPEAPGDSEKVLRSALVDPDWEVRVTAMLVVARMGLSDLWLNVKRMELPATSRSGLDRRWRSVLSALKKAVLAELAAEPRPTADNERSRLMLHLRKLAAGENDGLQDELHHWVNGMLQLPSRPG